ncbi:hypothetical protein Krac_0680 [Ktedonobacter racemifer DSM 44963]|uniref:Uncharacterized protein n=1 Tax=Ktedonobacter racemifer DSM 44963 TaxID=485913 RepID=D6U8B5_KTERA|nr:hypothetical protein Krac_0680 [Ktedonobacter racemifer DSM 44963]
MSKQTSIQHREQLVKNIESSLGHHLMPVVRDAFLAFLARILLTNTIDNVAINLSGIRFSILHSKMCIKTILW